MRLRLTRGAFVLVSSAALISLAAAAGIRHWLTQEPVPITLDSKIYDEYEGYYDFGEGYVIQIRREGGRLLSCAPEFLPRELFPATKTNFFFKGTGGRVTFHRDEKGRTDHLTHQGKNWNGSARKLPTARINPEGTNGMIAATTGGPALQAGIDTLKEGGSAADAAMTTALAQVVLAGGSYVSAAGIMMMVYYDAASGEVFYLDAQFNTPLEEKNPTSIPRRGGRTALVPGFMAGVEAAHARFGKVPFERLFQPALALAEKGFVLSNGLPFFIKSKYSVLKRFPETKRIFTRADGTFFRQGDLFQQPELAATLKRVAAQGASVMYQGEWGRKFVQVVRQNGGKITERDMKDYRAIWEKPVQTTYRDFRVFGPGFSAWGGVNSITALNLMERANLNRYGHYTKSPQTFFWLSQITASQWLAWERQQDLPPETRVTKETAALIWDQMQRGTWRYLPESMKKRSSDHTDGLVVVDRWGNVAAVNHTINTALWGDTGLFVDGVSIPDSARFQGQEIKQAGPGKRLPNGMSPLIILREGKPALASCATGGGLHQKTLQVLMSILDFDFVPQSAVDIPAFTQNAPTSTIVDQFAFEPQLLEGVKELGLKVRVATPSDGAMLRGYWVGIRIDPKTGRCQGGVSNGFSGRVAAGE